MSQRRRIALGLALPMAGRRLAAGALLGELTSEVQAAEAAGIDVVLVPEHHAGPPGALTEPLTTVTWLLARTNTVRVATGVLLLPLHPAVRVAEQGAMLQHASGGRLILGVGAGYQDDDFALFGVDRAQRVELLEEGLKTLRRAWAGEELAGGRVRPSLEGLEAPPLWLGAWSARGVERAALLADGWIADPIRTVEEVAAMAARYRQATDDQGADGQVVVMREGWVGPTDDAARATYGPVVEPIYRYYHRHGAFPPESGLTESELTLDRALRDRVVVGSPDTVAERLAVLVEATGADAVVLALRHPAGPPHDEVLAAIDRLGNEVRPRLEARLEARR